MSTRTNPRLLSLLRQLPTPRLVYDLGCGGCADALTYRAVWGNVPIVGLDHNRAALRVAQAIDPTLLLIEANLAALSLLPRADLILIRHPNVDYQPRTWQQLGNFVPHYLAPHSRLLVTTYTASEFDLMRRWLSDRLISVPMDVTTLDAVGLDGRDRYNGCFKLSDHERFLRDPS